MVFLYALAAVAVVYIVYSILSKSPASPAAPLTEPSLMRKRCSNDSCYTLNEVSLLRCSACSNVLSNKQVEMTPREANGFFLDEFMVPVDPKAEEDSSIWRIFDNLTEGAASEEPSLREEVRELRARTRDETEAYRNAIATFAIKPTLHEVYEETGRIKMTHLKAERELCAKLGIPFENPAGWLLLAQEQAEENLARILREHGTR